MFLLQAYPSARLLFAHIVSPGSAFVFIHVFWSSSFSSPYGNSDKYLFWLEVDVKQKEKVERPKWKNKTKDLEYLTKEQLAQ